MPSSTAWLIATASAAAGGAHSAGVGTGVMAETLQPRWRHCAALHSGQTPPVPAAQSKKKVQRQQEGPEQQQQPKAGWLAGRRPSSSPSSSPSISSSTSLTKKTSPVRPSCMLKPSSVSEGAGRGMPASTVGSSSELGGHGSNAPANPQSHFPVPRWLCGAQEACRIRGWKSSSAGPCSPSAAHR